VKITLTPSGAGATPFILADDSVRVVLPNPQLASGSGGQNKEGFVNRQKRLVQKTHLFRAAYALAVPRYNLENRFSFTVQRSFSAVEDCLAFIAGHPDNVPAQGGVKLENQTTTGVIVRYLPNAVVESVECAQHQGLSCNVTYAICGNGPWQNSP
jgi:hypothetical protein